MQRLLIDHLKRRKWYILGFVAYFYAIYCRMFLLPELSTGTGPRTLNFLFLAVIVFGTGIAMGRTDLPKIQSRIFGNAAAFVVAEA